MEGFTYSNIFETKGIEYIAILAFFAVLIPFWIILNRRIKNKKTKAVPGGSLSLRSIRVPGGMFFSSNHTWAFLERSGKAKIGIDELLLHFTGEVMVTNIKQPGSSVRKGEVIAFVEQEGKKLNIISPLSGTILENNEEIIDDPEVLYSNPYNNGWISRIDPVNWIGDTHGYYFSDKAMEWTKVELDRFKDFMATALKDQSEGASVILQDGGEICNNALSAVPEHVWNDFQKEFLGMRNEE